MGLYELMYDERLAQLLAHIGLPCSPVGKESTCNAGDPSSISGSGRSAGEEIGYHSSILGLSLWLSW